MKKAISLRRAYTVRTPLSASKDSSESSPPAHRGVAPQQQQLQQLQQQQRHHHPRLGSITPRSSMEGRSSRY